MNTPLTLADIITFKCNKQSLDSDIESDTLERKIAEVAGFSEKDKYRRVIESFAVIYSCTSDIELSGEVNAHESILKLCDFWQSRSKLSPTELWTFRRQLPNVLWDEWVRQWSVSQRVFEVDPAELPAALLTDEQKRELKSVDSPLVSADGRSLVG